MKDPIVEEVRKIRHEHEQRFGLDLHAICEDLRKIEKSCGDRVVCLRPRNVSVVHGGAEPS